MQYWHTLKYPKTIVGLLCSISANDAHHVQCTSHALSTFSMGNGPYLQNLKGAFCCEPASVQARPSATSVHTQATHITLGRGPLEVSNHI